MVDLNLTKRQQEIFDFIKHYAREVRLPADRSGDRQGRRAGLLLDRSRSSGQPRELRCAQAQPRRSRGRSSCSSTRRSKAMSPEGLPSSARSPPGSPSSPRRTSRSTSLSRDRRWRGGRIHPAGLGREHARRRHPRGRLRRRAPSGHRRRRRHRRRPARRGGDRQALLQGDEPYPPSAGEHRDGADYQLRRAGARSAPSGCSGRSNAARAPSSQRRERSEHERLFDPAGEERTLDAVVRAAWVDPCSARGGCAARSAAARSERPRARATVAECGDCGSRLE